MQYTADQLLATVGQRVRSLRQGRGWTQSELGRRAGVSPRFLLEVEKGDANISLLRLVELSAALGVSLGTLVGGLGPVSDEQDQLLALTPERRQKALLAGREAEKVALVGLRGAGKSSVGMLLGRRLGLPFVELDTTIEAAAGMRIGEIFAFDGVERYRDLERNALNGVLSSAGGLVLAVGGSLVTGQETWSRLRGRARTVWLKASPASHLQRVEAQGDLRPMRGHRDALSELKEILSAREPLYAQAELTVDTDQSGIDGAVERIAGWLQTLGPAN